VASSSEAPPDAPPNPALNLNLPAGDLLSVCQWPTTRLVEDVLLVGAEEMQGAEGAEETSEEAEDCFRSTLIATLYRTAECSPMRYAVTLGCQRANPA
jgi:hypothetical protein